VSLSRRAAAVAAALIVSAVLCVRGVERASAQSPMGAQMSPGAMPTIEIPNVPTIALQAMPGYGVAPLIVGFLVSFPDPSVQFQTWRWNFGDGKVSTLPPMMLFHTYANPGTYVVTLTATTAEGMIATAQAGVIVRPATAQ
jgi:PKD repeat protein